MRIEHEGGTDAWLAGTLVAPSVQGHGLPQVQVYGPIKVFFQASCRSLQMVIAAMKLKDAYSLKGKL